ncbi:MAG: OB-fold domain-containing protein [Deltaproteobacteria bacterium]|nr:OB-fold domain-containing protein [Deltaproteobacteria bacterium]
MTSKLYRPENWSASPLESDSAQLVGGRCARCGNVYFPRSNVCPGCGSREPMAQVLLSRVGKLYSYSVIHVGAPGFKAPYAVGYVDLPDGPRVFGHVDGWEDGPIPLDSSVDIYAGPIGKDREGEELISVRFRPLPSGQVSRGGT